MHIHLWYNCSKVGCEKLEKEILTIQNIQSDLRRRLRNSVSATATLVIICALTLWCFFALLDEPGHFIIKLEIAILPIASSFLAVRGVRSIYVAFSALNKSGRIVTDRVVGMQTKDHLHRSSSYQTFHLRFASYGEYVIPAINYRWSSLHNMDADMVYFHVECDDEFYLVLSKPHTGKILLAYNTKMFDYQPPRGDSSVS